jgi:hypothetical protein
VHEVGALFELMGRAEGARDGKALEEVQAEYGAHQAAHKRKMAFKALLEQQERPEEGAEFESFGCAGAADLEKGGSGGAIVVQPWPWLSMLDYGLLVLSLVLMVSLVALAFLNQMTITLLAGLLSTALIAYAASVLVFFLRRRQARTARSEGGSGSESAGVGSRGPLTP